jgi:hypothetical protein
MFDDRQREGLRRWYRRSEVLDEARKKIRDENWEGLEELIQMRSLVPLGRTAELPDYLKTGKGEALLPTIDPRVDQDTWEAAVEVGWQVVESELGVSRDRVHEAIGKQQKDDWDAFLASVEQRKRERGES